MPLPSILAPASAPVFLASGHAIDEDWRHASVDYATGHSRTRPVFTIEQRIVSVEWFLEPDAMLDVVDWYEDTLRAGALQFSARVANQEGTPLVWWAARWISFEWEMLHLGRGRVRGSIFLIGTPQTTSPETGLLSMEIVATLTNNAATLSLERPLRMEVSVALLEVDPPHLSSSSSSTPLSSGA